MMSNREVPQVMTMVEAALQDAASASGPEGPIFLIPEAGSTDIARLRQRATIEIDVYSGSDRPVVGPAIVMAKRIVRRGLRWYLRPPFEQQSSFNHTVLDLLERAQVENERLRDEVARLRRPFDDQAGAPRG